MQSIIFHSLRKKLLFIFVPLLVTACSPQILPTTYSTKIVTPSVTESLPFFTSTATLTPTMRPSFTVTNSPTTPAPTKTLTPSATLKELPTATYSILRGEVNVPHVSCFYGPHKYYLYKYGLVGGSNLEIIGRNVDTGYIEIRAIGGTNPCWMNSEWMNIKGDIEAIQPIDPLDVNLPQSPYYGPLIGVTVQRNENKVTVSWNYMYISPGKDSEQYPYLVESWVCQAGKTVFIPLGTYINSVELIDEPGCEDESYARVYGVEKHGYTKPVEVQFP